jgi:uncharacterized protein YfaP (DUF2135 family)
MHRVLISALLLVTLTSCGSDSDPTGPTPDPNPGNMEDSLNDYWPVSRQLQESFSSLNTLMDQIEAAFNDKTLDESTISALVETYVTQTQVVGARMDDLIALEDNIRAYGNPGKGMFTDTAGAIAKGLFRTVKKTVVSSGQMVRTGWRVLSGSHSLREALSASDSGIPIVSDAAKRLEEHNATRDAAIIDAISQGDTQEGFVPIGSLEGSTPQERIEYYRNLPDDHPLKKQTRGDVHYWHSEEKQNSVQTIKSFAQDQVKNYAGAISGSDALVEVGDQMLSPDQSPQDKGTVQSIVKDADSLTELTAPKTILIQKRDQPENEPKIAIVDGVDPDTEIDIATGIYDVVVIAEGYVRSIKEDLVILQDQTATMLHEMLDFAANSLILESVVAAPASTPINSPVTVSATAASVVGSDLTFTWDIEGGTFTGYSQNAATMTFTPTQVGSYSISLELRDTLGNERLGSAEVQTTGAEVEISSWMVTSEQFDDGQINPGEQVGVSITMINHGDEPVTGTARLQGQNRIAAQLTGSSTVTIPAGGTTDLGGTFNLPVDYSPEDGAVTLEFDTEDVTLAQDMIFDVVFAVEIDAISSPVTDRILTISGRVSNPSLPSANLVISGDIDQVYTLNLANGAFSQEVAIQATNQITTNSVLVVADAGSRHVEATTSFTSQVPPSALRVTLTWDTGGTDVDLWVTDPNGASCGWSNPQTASGLTLDFDDTNGYGPENITTTSVIPGVYSIRVHYWSDYDPDNAITTNCTVVVRLNEGTPDETTTTYYGTLYDSGDNWNVASITILGAGKALQTAGPAGLDYRVPQGMKP